MKLLLDTNVLARLCHPTAHRDVQAWFRDLLARGDAAPEILISVLADYELRRMLHARHATTSLEQLDRIVAAARYLPVTAEATRLAAERRGQQLGALAALSDADLIMAAQAELEQAVLVTSDAAIRSLPHVSARDWDAITIQY